MFFAWTFFFFAIDIFCTYCIYWSHVKIYILYIFPQIFPNKDLAKLRECVYIRDKLLTTKLEEHKVKHKLSPTQFSNFFLKNIIHFLLQSYFIQAAVPDEFAWVLKAIFRARFWGSLQSLGCGHPLNSCFSETASQIELKFGVLHHYGNL